MTKRAERLVVARAFGALAKVLSGALESDDARESAAGAPDAAAEARELDDLRVIDEQVRARALVLDVVREDVRFCGFEPEVCMPYGPKFTFSAQPSVAYVTCVGLGGWKGGTYMIFSVGRADVTADITSVRQFFTFSVIPSLSIMIIYGRTR